MFKFIHQEPLTTQFLNEKSTQTKKNFSFKKQKNIKKKKKKEKNDLKGKENQHQINS